MNKNFIIFVTYNKSKSRPLINKLCVLRYKNTTYGKIDLTKVDSNGLGSASSFLM